MTTESYIKVSEVMQSRVHTVDPMSTLLWFQALHLDTDFYDRHYQPGAYTAAIRDHMKNWHPGQG